MVGLAPPILKGPTSFLMDLVAHRCSHKVGNFSDRLWGVSMILVKHSKGLSSSDRCPSTNSPFGDCVGRPFDTKMYNKA